MRYPRACPPTGGAPNGAAHGQTPCHLKSRTSSSGSGDAIGIGHLLGDKTGMLTRSEMTIERAMTAWPDAPHQRVGHAPEGNRSARSSRPNSEVDRRWRGAGASGLKGPLRDELIVVEWWAGLSATSICGRSKATMEIHGDLDRPRSCGRTQAGGDGTARAALRTAEDPVHVRASR